VSHAVDSPYLVPFDERFDLDQAQTAPPKDAPKKKALEDQLDDHVDRLAKIQRKLYADDRFSVLAVFQAMDAAGKDSTIRKVFSGVNPAGFQVTPFKKPSSTELDHDFLWRTTLALPERGRIGVFNRSYYEEVLVVRVHPKILEYQRLPNVDASTIWDERFASIADFEKHLARNGTVVVKFFLNVSKDEQKARFLARLDDPKKNWKFSEGDLDEREHWADYQAAYQDALRRTSRPNAPWYCIPADDKPFMRATVASILADTIEGLPLRWPELSAEEEAKVPQWRARLDADR
jgi:PPK2 family polyphosphate:nucleotide phosphotransferase